MIIQTSNHGSQIWFDPDIWSECKECFFEPSHWRGLRAVVGRSQGRGETLFFTYQGDELVLRHYRRGGVVGKLNDDRYFYCGYRRSRCWREFQLLTKLCELGLPAPTPVAVRIIRDGFWYRGDLITKRIPEAVDLSVLLSQQRLALLRWRQIGEVIGRYHLAGVYHADLNCHNIMLSDSKVWLIDFDRGELRQRGYWCESNLRRLRRSLEKERGRQPHFHWLESDWESLLEGYEDTIFAVRDQL